MKPGRPVVTGYHAGEALAVLRECAAEVGAPLLLRGEDWDVAPAPGGGLRFSDAAGALVLPAPGLLGVHQVENAGLAVAALRASGLAIPGAGFAGVASAAWPARLQRLTGALAGMLGDGFELWLDGGHNEAAGAMLAAHIDAAWGGRPVYVLAGMKQGKNVAGFLAPLVARADRVWAVREPGQHLALAVADVVVASGGAALVGPDLRGALRQAAALAPGRVLVCGSLYLAGEALKLDGANFT